MTRWEELIEKQVAATVLSTVSRTVDRIADDMTAELLKDTQFRADMLKLIRRGMARTLDELNSEPPPGDGTT